MGLLGWFRKKSHSGSQFPGERLTIEEILQMESSTDMIIELSYGLSDKINRSGYESLTHPEKVLNSIFWLEADVNNGGFEQYYFNSSGNYALDTPPALEEIGAKRTAEIVKEANSHFPGGHPSKDWDERISLEDQVSEEIRTKWRELDSEFYKYEDPLEQLQVNYMKSHRDQIRV